LENYAPIHCILSSADYRPNSRHAVQPGAGQRNSYSTALARKIPKSRNKPALTRDSFLSIGITLLLFVLSSRLLHPIIVLPFPVKPFSRPAAIYALLPKFCDIVMCDILTVFQSTRL